MSSIFDATLLIRFDKSYAPGIMKTSPENFDISSDAVCFCSSVWPFPQDKIDTTKIPLVYSFNINSNFYHSLLFMYKDDLNAIVICTRRPYASLLQSFLKEVKNQFQLSEVPDPLCAFAYVTSMLDSWPRGAVESAVLTFPTSSLAITFDISHFSYLQFNPARYFNEGDLLKIWHCLITGSPILIMCQSADIACRACFSAFSLLTPLLYDDKCILWLQKTDPRYQEVLNGDKSYKIVATCYQEILDHSQHFSLILHVNEVKQRASLTETSVHESMNKLTTKVLRIILGELDMLLGIDAYADFVERQFATEHFRDILKEFGSPDMPKFEDFQLFESTETFKRWRKAQALREGLRNALLSYSPPDNFKDRTTEELMKIIEGIESIKVRFWNDAHVIAVLKSHESRVEKLLKRRAKTEDK